MISSTDKKKTMTVDGVTLTYEQLVNFYDAACKDEQFRKVCHDSKLARSTGYYGKVVDDLKREIVQIRAKVVLERAKEKKFINPDTVDFAADCIQMMMDGLRGSGYIGDEKTWYECGEEIDFAESVEKIGRFFAKFGEELSEIAWRKVFDLSSFDYSMQILDGMKKHVQMPEPKKDKSRERDVDYTLIEDSLMGGWQPKFRHKCEMSDAR